MAHRSAIGPQDLQEMEAGRGVRQHQPGSGTLGRNLLSQGNLHQEPVLASGDRDLYLSAHQVSLDRLEREHREQVPPDLGGARVPR